MKRVFALFLAVLCLACTLTATASMPARDGLLELTGYVQYEYLSGGYYSLDGHRLLSSADLSVYANRNVTVKGYADTSGVYAVNSLVMTEITVSGETTVRNASILGALLYDYDTHTYRIHDRSVFFKDDIAPYFGKYVRADGIVDAQGVLQASSITAIDPAQVRKFLSDEIFFATYHKANNRLRYALSDSVAVNGTIKKDSLYKQLAAQLTKADGTGALYIDGRRVFFEPNAQPVVKSSTLFAPVTALCDALGLFQAQTFAATNDILLSKGDFSITFTLNKRTAIVNDKKVTLPVAPYLSKAGAMLPVRFLCEKMGYSAYSTGKLVAVFCPQPIICQ